MEQHKSAVKTIAARVRYFYDSKKPFRIFHGTTSSTRRSQHWKDNTVDVSSLRNVLSVDVQKNVALVEPNVAMDELFWATQPYGLVAPVVMEFPGITVGGGFAGSSGESGSFRHGLFERTVTWIEIVLGNGEVITASNTKNSDIFTGASSAFGTLGVTTLLEIKLVDAKPYVALTYHLVDGMASAVDKMKDAKADVSVDYLDAILFEKHRGVVCVGRMVDTPGRTDRIQQFTRRADPWFYLHVKKLLPALDNGPTTDYVPLFDYLFRYDRGAFWGGAFAFQYFITPFNRVTRWALDYFMHSRVMYHALHKSDIAGRYVVQDMGVPYETAPQLVEYLDKRVHYYPLWLCPIALPGHSKAEPRCLWYQRRPFPEGTEMMVNFGIWGFGSKKQEEFIKLNRDLEQKVTELDGLKCLYAHAYYTEEEFWDIHDKERYDALRIKYHATHLPSLYDKVKVDFEAEDRARNASWKAYLFALFWSIWPLSGIYGVLHTILRTNYLLRRGEKKSY